MAKSLPAQLPKIVAGCRRSRRWNSNAFVDAGRAFRIGGATQVVPSPYGTLPLPADEGVHLDPGSATARGNGTPIVADVFGLGVFGLGSEVVRTVAEKPE